MSENERQEKRDGCCAIDTYCRILSLYEGLSRKHAKLGLARSYICGNRAQQGFVCVRDVWIYSRNLPGRACHLYQVMLWQNCKGQEIARISSIHPCSFFLPYTLNTLQQTITYRLSIESDTTRKLRNGFCMVPLTEHRGLTTKMQVLL